DLRIENGYKQDDLAKVLNVTASGYGYYEQGRNEPSLETLYKIAHFYKLSVDYLLGKINNPNNPNYYSVSKDLMLTEDELKAVQTMKELSLLKEIVKDAKHNSNRVHRYWEFINKELALNSTEI